MNKIDINAPIAQIIDEHPELLENFIEMGFKPLENKTMYKTLGYKVTLKQGAKLLGKSIDDIIQNLKWNGYEVKGD